MKRLLLLFLFLPLFVPAQVIVTVAGTGTPGYNGDGIAATAAMLDNPRGVKLDNSGNLYICDAYRIRKVSPAYNGVISTVVGVGVGGFSGDGGPAYFAKIFGVHDIAIDHHGNLYLAEAINNRIRKVTATDGIINTIAGTGFPGYNGDGIPATDAQLNSPFGIAVDSIGNVYIGDMYNYRLRMIDTAGTIRTIAGNGSAGFTPDGASADTAQLNYIGSVRIDKSNTIFFSDNLRIRKMVLGGTITTVAGDGTYGYSGDGGLATEAQLAGGIIELDTTGNLYIAEQANNRIRKVSVDGIISTLVGTGMGIFNGDGINPLLANVNTPSGIASNLSGDIFIGDQGNNRVRMITTGIADKVEGVTMPKAEIEVSPNPCRGNCKLKIAYPTNVKATVVITDMTGMRIMEFEASTNESVAMPAAHLPCGVYVITAIIGQSKLTGKLVVE